MRLPSFQERVRSAREFITSLYDDFELMLDAVEADGWPRPMARQGFEMHRRTWDVDGLVSALDAELHAFGGVEALERPVRGKRVFGPESMVHVWPALPGAGVTPVLFGWLVGARQVVRPSRRSRHFGQLFGERWLQVMGDASVSMEDGPRESWKHADIVVISGGDDTIKAIRDFMGDHGHRRAPHVIGFGHRVSFAVVVDDETPNTLMAAEGLAKDIVMWHQTGCFSARAVVFCGSEERRGVFAQMLGDAIEDAEKNLGATTLSNAELSRRAQARGVAEFTEDLWGQGLGWVQSSQEPFGGDRISTHAVTLHHIQELGALSSVLDIPTRNVQGVALLCADGVRSSWVEALGSAGATRICAPGQLQSPPPSWAHDGWPNVLDWVRVCTVDGPQ